MRAILFFLAVLVTPLVHANSYTDGNGIRLYHTLFNSQMMDAQAANALGLERAPDVATLTVALTKPLEDGTFSLGREGLLRAWVLNIVGQRTDLDFTPVVEGDVTYYIAQIKHTHRETLRVFILGGFEDGSRAETSFHQVMYVED